MGEAAEPAELRGTERFREALFVRFLVMWAGGFFVCFFNCLSSRENRSNWNLMGSCVLLTQNLFSSFFFLFSFFPLPLGMERAHSSFPFMLLPCITRQRLQPPLLLNSILYQRRGKNFYLTHQKLFSALTDLEQSRCSRGRDQHKSIPLQHRRRCAGPGERVLPPSHGQVRRR